MSVSEITSLLSRTEVTGVEIFKENGVSYATISVYDYYPRHFSASSTTPEKAFQKVREEAERFLEAG